VCAAYLKEALSWVFWSRQFDQLQHIEDEKALNCDNVLTPCWSSAERCHQIAFMMNVGWVTTANSDEWLNMKGHDDTKNSKSEIADAE